MIVQSKHLHIMHSWRPSWSSLFNLQCNTVLFRLPVSNILLYLYFVFSNSVVWFSLVFENLIQQQKDHNLNLFHFYVCFFCGFFPLPNSKDDLSCAMKAALLWCLLWVWWRQRRRSLSPWGRWWWWSRKTKAMGVTMQTRRRSYSSSSQSLSGTWESSVGTERPNVWISVA